MKNNKGLLATLKKYRVILFCFLAAVFAEVFLCNYQFFRTHGEDSIRLFSDDDGPIVTYSGFEADKNKLKITQSDNVYIEATDIREEVKNLYIGISDIEMPPGSGSGAVDITISMIDGGHTKWYSRGGAHTVSSSSEKSKYISLRPMGDLESLRITITGCPDGTVITLKKLSLNEPVPMMFSIVRCFLIAAFLLLLFSVRPDSGLFSVKYRKESYIQFFAGVGLCLILCVLVFHHTKYMTQYAEIARDPYIMLAHQLAQGKVDLDDELSYVMGIAEAEHPYIPDAREGYSYNWDTAFYNGHYYVYYGVVPEILMYLPFYKLTGHDLPIRISLVVELWLIIWGGFLVFLQLTKRFRPVPFVLWILLLAASLMGMYLMTLSKVPTFYALPPAMAIACTLWGLYFWLSSVRTDIAEGQRKYIPCRIAAGSLCMALVLGCRPQMVLGSILAVPIFMEYFLPKNGEKARDEDEKKDTCQRKAGDTLLYLLCGGIPYIAVFIPIMYYNALRFSGPLDFGAAYNLTAIDVTQVSSDMGKLIPGLFIYWFELPRITTVFPFIHGQGFDTTYVGDVFFHWGFGGLITCNLLLVFMFLGIRKREWIKGANVRIFIWLSMISGVVITVMNLMVGGYMPRYFCDITPFFFAAALPVIFALISRLEGMQGEKIFVSCLCYICIAAFVYHYFLYYTLEDGSQFGTWDRDVFVRAASFWQWWE